MTEILLPWRGEFSTPKWLIEGVEGTLGIKFNADLAACQGKVRVMLDKKTKEPDVRVLTVDNAVCDFCYTAGNSFLTADLASDFRKRFGRKKVCAWMNAPFIRSPGLLKFAKKVEGNLDLFELVAVLVNQDSTTNWHRVLMGIASEKWQSDRRIAYGHPIEECAENTATRAQDLFIIRRRKKEPRLPRTVVLRMWDPTTGDTDPYLADVVPWWKLSDRTIAERGL
jgi:hypothetical protein